MTLSLFLRYLLFFIYKYEINNFAEKKRKITCSSSMKHAAITKTKVIDTRYCIKRKMRTNDSSLNKVFSSNFPSMTDTLRTEGAMAKMLWQ